MLDSCGENIQSRQSIAMIYYVGKVVNTSKLSHPERFKEIVYRELHIPIDHQGLNRTIQLLRGRFFSVIPVHVCVKRNLTSKQQHRFFQYPHQHL